MKILITAPVFISQQVHLDFIDETLSSINTQHQHRILLVKNHIEPQYQEAYEAIRDKHEALDIDNDMGNNVSRAWNMGMEKMINDNFDYCLIPNLDIVFHSACIDSMVDFAELHDDAMIVTGQEWSGRRTLNSLAVTEKDNRLKVIAGGEEHDWELFDEHPHFSCFMLSRKTIDKLQEYETHKGEPIPGFFDVGFNRAYFEDQDFHQRILNAGLKAYKYNKAVFYHYGSRTIKSDTQVEKENSVSYEQNRQYFIKKWGYDSHNRIPSNEERVELAYEYPFNPAEPSPAE